MKFYPYEKRGAEKVLAMLKGEHKQFWGSFYAEALSLSYIEGGHEKYPFFKGGRKKFYPVLSRGGGGVKKVSDPFSHFVAPPPSP